jgi:hypothetical protein
MSVAAVARSTNMRDIPWGSWVLLALAVGGLVYDVIQPGGFQLISALAGTGPLVFAAAILFVDPPDRRFTWAALALAATPVIGLLSAVVPEAVFTYAPGDWKNSTPLLRDLGGFAREIGWVFGLIGLGLLGVALGGVRSRVSLLILAVGAALALANVVSYLVNFPEGFPLLTLATNFVSSVLYPLLVAFVFAAAVESRRSLTLIGAGLVLLNTVMGEVIQWMTIGPDANLDLLSLIFGGTMLLAWLAYIAGALRGELNATPTGNSGEL